MQTTFEKHKVTLIESNHLWQKIAKLKNEVAALQAESALLVKDLYKDFHDRIIDKHGLQGSVNLITSEDGLSITGVRLGIPGAQGLTFQELLLEKKNETAHINDDHSKSVEADQTKV